jgi:hypothetical protein
MPTLRLNITVRQRRLQRPNRRRNANQPVLLPLSPARHASRLPNTRTITLAFTSVGREGEGSPSDAGFVEFDRAVAAGKNFNRVLSYCVKGRSIPSSSRRRLGIQKFFAHSQDIHSRRS